MHTGCVSVKYQTLYTLLNEMVSGQVLLRSTEVSMM